MKLSCMFSLALLAFTLTAEASEPAVPTGSQDVKARIAQLETMIVPPAGTPKADVDAVYGQPKETAKLPANGKGSAADYPMHSYILLPPRGTEEFRAFLYVTYREGKVWRAGINHLAVLKNRADYNPGTPEARQQEREIESENRAVLIDLEEIHGKFAAQLKNASWNHSPQRPQTAPGK